MKYWDTYEICEVCDSRYPVSEGCECEYIRREEKADQLLERIGNAQVEAVELSLAAHDYEGDDLGYDLDKGQPEYRLFLTNVDEIVLSQAGWEEVDRLFEHLPPVKEIK